MLSNAGRLLKVHMSVIFLSEIKFRYPTTFVVMEWLKKINVKVEVNEIENYVYVHYGFG